MRPSTPEDGAAIVALMKSVGLHPHTEPEHLCWKYWQGRADWSGSRSFVLTDGRDLLAHAAVVPGTLQFGGIRARAIHMIDWAARRDAVGAGVALMKRIGMMTDFLLGVGGSRHTLKIMQLIGYAPCGTVTGYVCALSPLVILKRAGRPRWKLGARVARSLFWSLSSPRADMARWQARRVKGDEVMRIAAAFYDRRSDVAFLGRTPELISHALNCPIVPVELYAVERAGQAGGYFVLSYAPGQARLADWWMNSDDPEDWRALAHLAVRQAKRRGGLAELVAWSSDPRLSRILDMCGFHPRLTLPIYLRASGALAIPKDAIRVQMIDSDAFYLYLGRNELWA